MIPIMQEVDTLISCIREKKITINSKINVVGDKNLKGTIDVIVKNAETNIALKNWSDAYKDFTYAFGLEWNLQFYAERLYRLLKEMSKDKLTEEDIAGAEEIGKALKGTLNLYDKIKAGHQ